MNEQSAVTAIMRERYLRNFCLPRFTPPHWFECDVFEVTPGGKFVEYEVKLTLSDFRADAKKREVKIVPPWDCAPGVGRHCLILPTKHERLIAGDKDGPSRFWYAAPKGLIPLDILPTWAGLLELEYYQHGEWISVRRTVEAPPLHKLKIDPKITEKAQKACYYRMHDLMQKRQKFTHETLLSPVAGELSK